MAIGIDTFDLSMTSPDTGRYLTANFYTVDGVTNADGSLRQLSIGQLVMAICLSRASKLEADIIALMEEMNTTSAELKIMTTIEEKVIGWTTADPQPHPGYEHLYHDTISGTGTNYDGKTYMDVLSKMDEKNTFSQQKMIELQSLTNKRDQSYDMISNVLKSLNTTIIGNINNM